MIEQIRARLSRAKEHVKADPWYVSTRVYIADVGELLDQLSASQRREKAAGCDGCAEWGKWENEIEYGYPSPCTKCKRRCTDNWHRPHEAGEEQHG